MVNCLAVKTSKKKTQKTRPSVLCVRGVERQEEKNGQKSFDAHCSEKTISGNK